MPVVKPRTAASAAPAAAAVKPTTAKVGPKKGAAVNGNGHDKTAAVAGVSTNEAEIKGLEPGNLSLQETVVEVQRRYPGGTDTSEVIEVRPFITRTASVSVSAKQRMGSIAQGGEVSVMVTVPCYLEELDGAETFASDKLSEYLATEQDRLVELAGPDVAARNTDTLPGEGEEPADEQTAEGAAEAEAEEGAIDADYIRGLDEEEFTAFCSENNVEIDLADFENDLDAAKEAVIEHMVSEGMLPAEGEATEETVEEGAGEGDDEPYTEEQLTAMDMADLGQIFEAWEINGGKLPAKARTASPKDHKARCVKMILDYQENPQ